VANEMILHFYSTSNFLGSCRKQVSASFARFFLYFCKRKQRKTVFTKNQDINIVVRSFTKKLEKIRPVHSLTELSALKMFFFQKIVPLSITVENLAC
jgi:hypothetical protein